MKKVEADLKPKGLTFRVYDCYRPTQAVAAFVAWSKEPGTPDAKLEWYPNLDKTALFPNYIATRSGHSRGATLDVTVAPIGAADTHPQGVSCTAPQKGFAPDGSLAMGTSFDCFDKKANTDASGLTQEEVKNRALLRDAMEAPRLQELSVRMVALHVRARALPGHLFRLSHRAATKRR